MGPVTSRRSDHSIVFRKQIGRLACAFGAHSHVTQHLQQLWWTQALGFMEGFKPIEQAYGGCNIMSKMMVLPPSSAPAIRGQAVCNVQGSHWGNMSIPGCCWNPILAGTKHSSHMLQDHRSGQWQSAEKQRAPEESRQEDKALPCYLKQGIYAWMKFLQFWSRVFAWKAGIYIPPQGLKRPCTLSCSSFLQGFCFTSSFLTPTITTFSSHQAVCSFIFDKHCTEAQTRAVCSSLPHSDKMLCALGQPCALGKWWFTDGE